MENEYRTLVSAVTDLQPQFDIDARVKVEEFLTGSENINKRGLVAGLIARGLVAMKFEKTKIAQVLEKIDQV